MEAIRLRDRLAGRATVQVRDRQGRVVQAGMAANTITTLGQLWLFWTLGYGFLNQGAYVGTVVHAIAGEVFGADGTYLGSSGQQYFNGLGGAWFDGTVWHCPVSPWSILALSDTSNGIGTTNVAPAGILVAAFCLEANTPSSHGLGWNANGQTLDNDGIEFTCMASPGSVAPPPVFVGPNTVQIAQAFAYNTTGTSLTVASLGFTSGLYAQTGSTAPTTWYGMTNANTNSPFLLTGAGANAAPTENLSVATWLVLPSAITVPNGTQLSITYDLQFQPAT